MCVRGLCSFARRRSVSWSSSLPSPSHVEKSPHKSPAWFAIPPPRAKDAGSTTVLLWLVAGCLAGKQPAYTRAVPRVLRQSERVLPPWLWSPSGGVPNMAGSRTARSPVASAPFPARGLHPSTPSRPARGVTSGRESAFPTLSWASCGCSESLPAACVSLGGCSPGPGSSLCTCAGGRRKQGVSERGLG